MNFNLLQAALVPLYFSTCFFRNDLPEKLSCLRLFCLESLHEDTAHYWVLKSGLDPYNENVRVDPGNYIDHGIIDPPSGNDPCNIGYVELCGIYVIPNPVNKKQPYFNRSVNEDIYMALNRNEYLEGKVFFKDL